MTTRADIVAEARRWVGTPFQHQQRLREVACDCIGLVGGVGIALGLLPADPQQLPGIDEFTAYGRQPDGVLFKAACDRYLVPIDVAAAEPGDVVAMTWLRDPHHIGILTDHPAGGVAIVHALNAGPCRVVEHRLDARWRGRVLLAYSYPGVA